METVFLGLGSNIGNSAATILDAFTDLGALLEGARISSLYRSAACYYEDQPDFINAVATGTTGLGPFELLAAVNAIEAKYGRDRQKELFKGPRSLDIDILLYGNHVVKEASLSIPHAGLKERKFALLPLVELDPGLVDPESGLGFLSILASLTPQGIYLLGTADYDRLYT